MTDPTKTCEDRRTFLPYAPLGLVPVLFGPLWVAYIYAWASMVNPALIGWSRHSLILKKMIPGAVPGVMLIFLGVSFSSLCVFHAVFGSGRVRPTAIRVAVFVVVLSGPLVLGLLFILA